MLPMIITVAVLVLVVFGMPVVAALLLRPKSSIGGKSSFSRWWTANRDRTAAAKEIAQRHGMRYAGDTLEERERLEDFLYFRGFNVGAVMDLVVGEDGPLRTMLFSNSRSRSIHTLALFEASDSRTPAFRIGARDFPFRDRTVAEISFDGVPAFSAAYEVRGEPEAEVRALLNAFVRTELAGMGSLWIEGRPSALLCVGAEDYTLLVEREEFLQRARKVFSIIRGK